VYAGGEGGSEGVCIANWGLQCLWVVVYKVGRSLANMSYMSTGGEASAKLCTLPVPIVRSCAKREISPSDSPPEVREPFQLRRRHAQDNRIEVSYNTYDERISNPEGPADFTFSSRRRVDR
jgi:hypothetical protein